MKKKALAVVMMVGLSITAAQAQQKPKFIMVNAECTAGFLGYCLAEDLNLSAPSGVWVSDLAGAAVNISSNGGDMAGSYQYNIRLDVGNGEKRSCSGSFTIDGLKANVSISVESESCQGYINAF